MIPSSVENVLEKGSEEVRYSNEQLTHTIADDGFGFAAQDINIDYYASSIGLSGMVSLLLSTSKLSVIFLKSDEVEDIMLQVSNFATSTKFDGGGCEKLPLEKNI